MPQELITFECTECRRENYHSSKNKKNTPERIEVKKYCRWCRKHTAHKEAK